MATNILALPELSMPCTIESNMDWIDAITFFDAKGSAVALDGIDFRLQVRVSADLPDVLVDASTDNGLLQILSSGFTCTLNAQGAGYLVGDLIYLAGGSAVAPAVVAVKSVTVKSLGQAVTPTGTTGGHVVGETVALQAPTNTPIVSDSPCTIVVDAVDSNGNITGYHIANGGNLTVAPFAFLSPVKSGFTGQTVFLNPSFAIASIVLKDPGIYTALPPSPAGQASTTGTGVGATFTLSQTNNALAIQIPAGDLVHPLIESAGIYQIQAVADGYTQNIASGPMTVTQGIVR